MIPKIFILSFCTILIIFEGCLTGGNPYRKIRTNLQENNFSDALNNIDRKFDENPNESLRFAEKALIAHYQGNYPESNLLFEEAMKNLPDIPLNKKEPDEIAQLLAKINFLQRAFLRMYIFEIKALNAFMLNDLESTILAANKFDSYLNQLSEIGNQRNPFLQHLVAKLYEQKKMFSEAYISYRIAANNYENHYSLYFKIMTPVTLKFDLLSSLVLSKYEELDYLKKYFEISTPTDHSKEAQLHVIHERGNFPIYTQKIQRISVNENDLINMLGTDLNQGNAEQKLFLAYQKLLTDNMKDLTKASDEFILFDDEGIPEAGSSDGIEIILPAFKKINTNVYSETYKVEKAGRTQASIPAESLSSMFLHLVRNNYDTLIRFSMLQAIAQKVKNGLASAGQGSTPKIDKILEIKIETAFLDYLSFLPSEILTSFLWLKPEKYELQWDITDNTGKSINKGAKELEIKNPYEKSSLILSTIQ